MRSVFGIGVIGCGPTGTCVATELLSRLDRRPPDRETQVVLIDAATDFGHGYAFHSDRALNMRAATLSMTDRNPADFTEWIRADPGLWRYHDLEYPPRRIFGDYLQARFAEALRRVRPPVSVDHWATKAVDLEATGSGYRIIGADGAFRDVGAVVLATGESRHNAFSHLSGSAQFVPSPWQLEMIADIPAYAKVAILGSSLSAVDTCIELLHGGHSGEISCISRRRGLPRIQGGYERSEPRYLTADWLKRVTAARSPEISLGLIGFALKAELDGCARAPYQPGSSDPREWFSSAGYASRCVRDQADVFTEALELARTEGTAWYYLLDSIAHLTPAIWSRLASADRKRMLTNYYSPWCEYRHSMPLANAVELESAIKAGQIRVLRNFRSVRRAARGSGLPVWELVIGDRNGSTDNIEDYDWVVDATGGQVRLACEREPLLVNCFRNGMLRSDQVGGIDVRYGTCRALRADTRAWSGIFVVGPLTFGTHFYTNSFETNRDCAIKVAAQIDDLLRSEEKSCAHEARLMDAGPGQPMGSSR
jgi:uncharacterized NAD(P)/FAD-binding protein YdhS